MRFLLWAFEAGTNDPSGWITNCSRQARMALTEEQLGDRLTEVTKYLRTLKSAEHLDLAIASMTEVFPRYCATHYTA